MPPFTHSTSETLQRSIDRHRRVTVLSIVCQALLIAIIAVLAVLLVVA